MMILNTPIVALSTLQISLIVIIAVLVIVIIALYLLGRNAEKKQAKQEEMLKENAQVFSVFVIDKKKMKLKDANLPSVVLEQTPKYARRAKVPVVKVKAGPRVMNLIADAKVYDQILPKQEIKATVSGIYITSFKRIRGPVYHAPEKKGLFKRKKKQ